DTSPMVAPEHARMVMECYSAADISAEMGDPVGLPLSNASLAQLADMKAAQDGK
ncbi:MAG: gfo/Idh/MocA family oxidoreductase, partial [Octadecabacter sp.]|nr:gfo/Idh/MocA family oxidoreductase [Octadecabacter sp.]